MKLLRGWKSIADYCGVHVKTVQKWHYQRLRMPIYKSSLPKCGGVLIHPEMLHEYLLHLKHAPLLRCNSKVLAKIPKGS